MFGSGAPSFGATTQSSAGTLFGAGNTQSTTPAFGSNVTNSATAGTLFGGPASAAAAVTTPGFGGAAGGFGAKPATSGFGATSTTGGLFGNVAQQANNAGATGFGGFGNTQQPATSTATTGFGGFGAAAPATSTAGTGFGGFGAAAPATSTAGTGFGGFGAAAPATSTAGTGFGGFGAAPATSTATTGFGGFGAAPATSTASTGFGGFGAAPATSTASTGFGGFGAAPATSTASTGFGGFGAAPATSTASTGFGGFGAAPATSAAPTSAFGGFGANAAKPTLGFGGGLNTTATGFGNNPLFANKTQPGFNAGQPGALGQQAAPPEKVWEDLAVLRAHWDPTSPLCHFKHYFYNKVSPGEAHLYGRPPNQDENLWNEAVRNNPDPSNYVPVLAIGFEDVWKRMELQANLVDRHQNKLQEIDDRLKQVQRQNALDTSVKLEEYKRRHIDLSKRLLRLLRHAQVLRYKGFPLNDAEETTIEQLHQMSNQAENPAQLNIKMLGIWNQLQTLKKKVQTQEGTTEVWRTLNEEDKAIIAKILQDEQRGISQMVDTIKKGTAELEDIETRLKSARSNK